MQKDSEYKAARTTLEGLAHGAASEEATGFNPSGISNVPDEAVLELSDDVSTSETTNSHQASRNRDTDTSPSDAASSTTESTYLMPRLTTFNNESEEDKVLQLQCLFPELKEYDIKHSLKGANGDFQAALDDLLNIQYLQSTGQQSKGVDGFFQPDEEIGKSKRNKRKGKASVSSLNADSAAEVKGSRDVEKEMKRKELVSRSQTRADIYRQAKTKLPTLQIVSTSLLGKFPTFTIESIAQAEPQQWKSWINTSY